MFKLLSQKSVLPQYPLLMLSSTLIIFRIILSKFNLKFKFFQKQKELLSILKMAAQSRLQICLGTPFSIIFIYLHFHECAFLAALYDRQSIHQAYTFYSPEFAGDNIQSMQVRRKHSSNLQTLVQTIQILHSSRIRFELDQTNFYPLANPTRTLLRTCLYDVFALRKGHAPRARYFTSMPGVSLH